MREYCNNKHKRDKSMTPEEITRAMNKIDQNQREDRRSRSKKKGGKFKV